MDEKAGTFLVTSADDGVAELVDVDDGQVLALSSNPGLEAGDVVEGTAAPDPPLDVSWSLVSVDRRYRIAVDAVDEPPAEQAHELADGLAVGELAREPLEDGELHVLGVRPAETAGAVEAVVGDEETTRRAARLGARRAEVRGADGVVAVRYLVGASAGQ